MLALEDCRRQGAAMRLLLPLALATGLLGVCSQAGTEQLQEDLEAQREVQVVLQSRLDEYEAQLSAHAQTDVPERLDVTDRRVADLDRRLGELDARLQGEAEAQEAAVGEIRMAVAELRESLQELNPKVGRLQREAGDLTSRLNLLEQRFANHSRHPPG